MQDWSWDDLKYVIAIARLGTFSAAAKHLHVDDTTVSRRLKALEEVTQARLFTRSADGRLDLTQNGRRVLDHAEAMERRAGRIGEALELSDQTFAGTVRVTAVPLIANRFLVPRLPAFFATVAHLQIELIPTAQDLSLTRREADLAVRLSRPRTGGRAVLARKIGVLDYGVFAPASGDAPAWITYEDSMAHLPQARWEEAHIDRSAQAQFRVADAETATEAVAAGLGRALLPRAVAAADPRLRDTGTSCDLTRDVWLLSHRAQGNSKPTRAVAQWISQLDWSAPKG